MPLNILAAIASRTSHLASSTSMPGLYLDSCQTLIIGEEGELQAIFKRLHCFIRTSRNERKLRILLHCPKFVQDYRNLRYARISMLWSNDSSQNRVSTDQYHLTVWRAYGADAVFSDLRWSSVISFQAIASSYLSQERNFRTNRDRLKKSVVTSKGRRKWETFH